MLTRLARPTLAVALSACALACAAHAGAAQRAGSHSAARVGVRWPRSEASTSKGSAPTRRPPKPTARSRGARALGAKIVRIELPWAALEPTGPGQLNPAVLPFLDRFFADAASAHIEVIGLVDVTPCWASSAPEELRHACAPGAGRQAFTMASGEPRRLCRA